MDNQYSVILITVPSDEVGEKIAVSLLEQNLAACVNILPAINSLYMWKGQAHHDQEILLVVKSRAELFEKIVPAVKRIHPYEVPEIIALPILMGSQSYLDWIGEETKQ